jgi:hypothetical protein
MPLLVFLSLGDHCLQEENPIPLDLRGINP